MEVRSASFPGEHSPMITPSEQQPQDGITGLIERVTFHSEETGFAVLRVKAKGHRDLVTVVGTLATVNAGEWVTAQGLWVRDKEHGLQLKADFLKCTEPTSREGIEKYLGSGMIKGIGPVYAKKLVDKFGADIFTIIEQYSPRLEEIGGIGPERRKRIKEAWKEQKVIREIMVFLHSNGVSTSRAVRIYKTYGENSIATVRADPYVLAREIHGIGFKTADQVAHKLGIPRDSILRARAGLGHVLLEATSAGHCALPRDMLLENAEKLLEVDPAIIAEALARLLLDGKVVEESIDGELLVFLPALKFAEEVIADKIRQLARTPCRYPDIELEKAISWCEGKTCKALALQQKEAIRQALASRVMVITGGPGVGKTTLVNSLLKILRAKKVKCLLAAPTGRAAKRLFESTGVEARTIHRLLEFLPSTGAFSRNENNPLDCDLLIVDEVSMVDVPLMHKLLRALPLRGHLIFVGDADQLPSVGPGMVLHHFIESGVMPVVWLTEIFRQAAQSRIITNAHRINEGQMPEFSESPESDFFFIEREEPETIQATLLQMVRERIPRKLGCNPVNDVQVLCPMNRGTLGVRTLNELLQGALNPLRSGDPFVDKFGWKFRLRDKLMQIENNYDKDVFNGDIGVVTAIDPDEREIAIRFDKKEVRYDFNELDEVVPAYAATIHKAQGSEFPVVVIPVAMQHFMMLQRNLVYTGVTRGKQLVVLIGQKKALGLAVHNNQTRRRYSGLLQRLKALS